MEIKITPSSFKSCLAIYNLGYIKVNQAECELLLLCVKSKIRFARSSFTPANSCNSSNVNFLLSAYTNPSLPVLYGGSMYISFIFS